jgi:hypothetical protein
MGVGVGRGVGVSVGTAVGVSVGVRVGVGGKGVGVAFFFDRGPGIVQAVYRRQKMNKLVMSQNRVRLVMLGTITEEQGGVK